MIHLYTYSKFYIILKIIYIENAKKKVVKQILTFCNYKYHINFMKNSNNRNVILEFTTQYLRRRNIHIYKYKWTLELMAPSDTIYLEHLDGVLVKWTADSVCFNSIRILSKIYDSSYLIPYIFMLSIINYQRRK